MTALVDVVTMISRQEETPELSMQQFEAATRLSLQQKEAVKQISMQMETLANRITLPELEEGMTNPKQPEKVADMISWHQETDKQTSKWLEADKLNLMVVDAKMSCQSTSQTKIPNKSLP